MRRELFNGTNIWGTIDSASHFPNMQDGLFVKKEERKKGEKLY